MTLSLQYKHIDGIDRVLSDLEIIRESDEHKINVLYFGIPSLVVWGLGIPALYYFVFKKGDLLEKHYS